MSKSAIELELPLPPGESRSLCSSVVAEHGWTVEAPRATLVEAREDPAHLHCHCPPAKVRLSLEEAADGTTALTVTATVPGFGPVSAKHAREQADFIARRIGLAAAAAGRDLA